jgi:rfaE bifunctional protein nucleotidyltransferase chain/domain/rfaE bifunctional protein kinase chain/domain
MSPANALVVVGDSLLDRDLDGHVERLSPDAPVPVVEGLAQTTRPGGAALAAALAAADGWSVTLVSALAGDGPGRELAAAVAASGVHLIDIGLDGTTPEKVRVRAGGRTLLRLDRGGEPAGAGDPSGPWRARALDTARRAIGSAAGVLVSDYGRGVATEPGIREAVEAVARVVPLVWDPHPRGASPVRGATLVTPNRREAADAGVSGDVPQAASASALAHRWDARAVAVTLGADGALLAPAEGPGTRVHATPVTGGDPCGAGDRFASRTATLLAAGVPTFEAVSAAVTAASAFVEGGGAAGARVGAGGAQELAPRAVRAEGSDRAARPLPTSADAVVSRTRAHGGAVVATGGCFDLLHAGHVATLTAARALGDCLVVLVNSDASVRRLKGAERPVVPASDRAAVLEALAAVDATVVFEEDTPEAALERLCPDVWAKGGDYDVADLPEAHVMRRMGGRAVVLPFVDGCSTTRLIEEALVRGPA